VAVLSLGLALLSGRRGEVLHGEEAEVVAD
jgi:hypothetical protein